MTATPEEGADPSLGSCRMTLFMAYRCEAWNFWRAFGPKVNIGTTGLGSKMNTDQERRGPPNAA